MPRSRRTERPSIGRACLFAAVAACTASSGFAQPTEEKRAQAAENFAQADADGDGSLTSSEFETFIHANAEDDIGRAKTIKARGLYARAFRKLDRDRDGRIQREEIRAAKSASKAD